MKLATWNVNSLTVRLGQVEDWVKKAQPDLLLLQETKQENIKFPHDAISALGYHAIQVYGIENNHGLSVGMVEQYEI